ncbi:AraC-type DNA-binding protein [Flexibacter flexilis DSM 6793]|uniref:AraC-type DNA-binding protein n=1 Tax=Flexibacter flexilis DSM 6793 TaxID=927664 RepID=A0A1I1I1F6_9BACT|nr:AraC family transcriptional regulator [Flexibacter flexilis]SFC29652.1 AraC-type DNA-binding protein [Flexibacter flexilis DSM 6793]
MGWPNVVGGGEGIFANPKIDIEFYCNENRLLGTRNYLFGMMQNLEFLDLPQSIIDSPHPQINSEQFGIVDYKNYLSDTPKSKIQLHKNLISIVLEGVKVIQDTEQLHIDAAHLVCLKAGRCLMSERLSATNQYSSLLLFFDDAFVANFIQKYNIQFAYKPLEKPYLLLEKDDFINNLVSSLQILLQNPNTSLRICALKIEELLLYWVEKYGAQILNFWVNDRQTDENMVFRHVVERNVFNKLTIEELAFLCNMSASTFKRKFLKVYNTSPNVWFVQQRLAKAAYLLKSGQSRPSDIYLEVGFDTLSGFIQSFKQHYGYTPKRFQNSDN